MNQEELSPAGAGRTHPHGFAPRCGKHWDVPVNPHPEGSYSPQPGIAGGELLELGLKSKPDLRVQPELLKDAGSNTRLQMNIQKAISC